MPGTSAWLPGRPVAQKRSSEMLDPRFGEKLRKAAMEVGGDEIVRRVQSIQCSEHGRVAELRDRSHWDADGRMTFTFCCEGLKKQVTEAFGASGAIDNGNQSN